MLELMSPGDIAQALLCFYLGVNLMTQLDEDSSRIEAWFELTSRLTPMVRPMFERS